MMTVALLWADSVISIIVQNPPEPRLLTLVQSDALSLKSQPISTESLSLTELWLDFRKVPLDDSLWSVEIRVGEESTQLAAKAGLASKMSFFTVHARQVVVVIALTNKSPSLAGYLILFQDCCSYYTVSHQSGQEESSMFMFSLSNSLTTTLPVNSPVSKVNLLGEDCFFFLRNSSNYSLQPQPLVLGANQFSSPELFWGTKEALTVPYIPFLSNCQFRTDLLFLELEMKFNKNCKFLLPNETEPLGPLRLGSRPVADECSLSYECAYDEPLTEKNAWFNQPNSTKIMYVSQKRVSASNFSLWSAPGDKVPVVTITPSNIESGAVPQSVQLVIKYYQESQTQKTILKAFMIFDSYSQNPSEPRYRFTMTLSPMSHSEVLIAFGFQWYVYLLLYLLVGVAITLEVVVFAFYHWLTNRKEEKAALKLWLFTRIFVVNILIGLGLALVPTALAVVAVKAVSSGSLFGVSLLEFGCVQTNCFRSPFDYLSSNFVEEVRFGRSGIGMIVLGGFMCYQTIEGLICYTEPRLLSADRVMMGNEFSPRLWRKGHFVFMAMVIMGEILVLLFLSLSSLFSVNIWAFFASMKIVFMVVEEFHEVVLSDALPKSALKIVEDLSNYIATLSAPDFLTYLFGFIIDLGTQLFMRSYMFVIWNSIVDYTKDRLEELASALEMFLKGENDEDKEEVEEAKLEAKLEEAQVVEELQPFILQIDEEQHQLGPCPGEWSEDELETALKARLREYVALRQKQHHLLIETKEEELEEDYEVELNDVHSIHSDALITIFSAFLNPVVISLFWMMYDENKILQQYEITPKAVIFYFLTALVIAIFLCPINILFVFVCENYLGYESFAYAESCFERFRGRSAYWVADCTENDPELEAKLRGVDKYCFSSQFFFLLSIFGMGGTLVVIGITTFLDNKYNPISDVYSPLFTLFWVLIALVLDRLFRLLARKANLWQYQQFADKPEDPAATEMAQTPDEDSGESLVGLRLDKIQHVLVLRDEQVRTLRITKILEKYYEQQEFRVEFVRQNAGWILQHLEEIFSEEEQPEVLRPLILKAIQQEQNKLVNRQPVLLSEEQFPENRRNRFKAFQNIPQQAEVKAVILTWQRRAKALMRAKSFVNYYIEKTCKPQCECCGSLLGLRALLTTNVNTIYCQFLAREDIKDIKTFEHINSWQTYFAQHANMLTLCFECSEMVESTEDAP